MLSKFSDKTNLYLLQLRMINYNSLVEIEDESLEKKKFPVYLIKIKKMQLVSC